MTNVHCGRVVLTDADSKGRGWSLASFSRESLERGSLHNEFLVSGAVAQPPRKTLIHHNGKKATQLRPEEQLFP